MRRSTLSFAKKVDRTALCVAAGKALHRSSSDLLKMENDASAKNYKPLPVVFAKAKGVTVTDPEGRHYLDFLSGYGAVSMGHLHPRLLSVAKKQMNSCTLSSRAFHNDQLGVYADFITKFFGYDKVLPMNTGAEGVETALKLARKWGYKVKGIKKDKAIIVCCDENFHGRTFGAISMSNDPSSYENYGPQLPGFIRVPYGDAAALEKVFNQHGKNICGFIAEPIQGEAGVVIPPKGYFKQVRKLCTKHNIMMIADEVQSGLGRSGKMLAIDHEGVRPDAVVLAKALSGGFLPVAAVLADKKFMDVFEPGSHGSTFGGAPLSCAIAIESLRILHDEKIAEKSAVRGEQLDKALNEFKDKYSFIKEIRCRGLFAAMEFDHNVAGGQSANKFMNILKDNGVLAKTTHSYTIRISPPLIISEALLKKGINVIEKSLDELSAWIAKEEAKAAKPTKFKVKAKKSKK